MLLPGLLASGIGSLVSIGIGSFTGLSTSAYAIGTLSLPAFGRPTFVDFAWTIALAVAVAAGCVAIIVLGRRVNPWSCAGRSFSSRSRGSWWPGWPSRSSR